MPQSSSKRGRDTAGDTEDTDTYPGQTAVTALEEPPHSRTPQQPLQRTPQPTHRYNSGRRLALPSSHSPSSRSLPSWT